MFIFHRRSRITILVTALGVSVAALFVLSTVMLGMRAEVLAQLNKSQTKLMVYGSGAPSFLKVFETGKRPVLNDETVKTFSRLDGVDSITRHMIYHTVSTVEVPLFGQTLVTDSLLFGSEELEQTDKIPAVISKKLLDFYNLSIAASQNLPQLSESNFIGTELQITPGKSSFFPLPHKDEPIITATITGFSNEVDLLGITLPLEVVRKLNVQGNADASVYNRVTLTARSPQQALELTTQLEAQGYRVNSEDGFNKSVQRAVRSFEIALLIFASIIALISFMLIGITIHTNIIQQKKEIGLVRAIGSNKNRLYRVIGKETVLIASIGTVLGLIFGVAFILIVNSFINNFSLTSLSFSEVTKIQPTLIFIFLVVTPTLTCLIPLPFMRSILKSEPAALLKN